MAKYETSTKDYLFAILMSGNEEEKNGALRELCNRYKEINFYSIKRLAEQHTKWRFYLEMEERIMSNLIASAGTKEDLEKMINEYYFSTNYIITENNDVYNTKKECTLDTVKVEVKKNRWRFVRV